ncbi:MAG: hypothetical protein GX358_04670 [candidate division WS1 bacterium]|nr:hypothetical protein [candidate division WS1 bacterium]
MTVGNRVTFDEFKERLDGIISGYQRPEERRIAYGNLRHEYSEYSRDGNTTVNIAVIYETPGGSTTQINITYDSSERTYSYLDRDLENQVVSHNPDEVISTIEEAIHEIPGKRARQLITTIDSWMGMGKGRYEIFGELNKLLQTEFLGGRITTTELKEGIQHVVSQHNRPAENNG